jgi:hypothetical protein
MFVEASGKAAMRKTQVYGWHIRFCNGRAGVNSMRWGRQSTSTNEENIERVRSVVLSGSGL